MLSLWDKIHSPHRGFDSTSLAGRDRLWEPIRNASLLVGGELKTRREWASESFRIPLVFMTAAFRDPVLGGGVKTYTERKGI
jgi:hypothetical protein